VLEFDLDHPSCFVLCECYNITAMPPKSKIQCQDELNRTLAQQKKQEGSRMEDLGFRVQLLGVLEPVFFFLLKFHHFNKEIGKILFF